MKSTLLAGLAALLAYVVWSAGSLAAEDGVGDAAAYTSRMEKGVVSIAPDQALSDGRLILKVVAFNRTEAPASFGVDHVSIVTAAGKSVALMSLERLIDETRMAASPNRSPDSAHQASNYGRPGMRRTQTGEMDVSGYAGANDAFGREVSARAAVRPNAAADEETAKQVENLKAAILQRLVIAPGAADGGQIVTDKLKFARSEKRALRVIVDFNEERHEFDLAVNAR